MNSMREGAAWPRRIPITVKVHDQTWQAIGQEPRTRAFLKEMLEVVRGADQGFSAPGWP
jgi:hypothetical protein